MDYILELILKNEDHQLDKILSEQATKRGSNPLELTVKNFKEMGSFKVSGKPVQKLSI